MEINKNIFESKPGHGTKFIAYSILVLQNCHEWGSPSEVGEARGIKATTDTFWREGMAVLFDGTENYQSWSGNNAICREFSVDNSMY